MIFEFMVIAYVRVMIICHPSKLSAFGYTVGAGTIWDSGCKYLSTPSQTTSRIIEEHGQLSIMFAIVYRLAQNPMRYIQLNYTTDSSHSAFSPIATNSKIYHVQVASRTPWTLTINHCKGLRVGPLKSQF